MVQNDEYFNGIDWTTLMTTGKLPSNPKAEITQRTTRSQTKTPPSQQESKLAFEQNNVGIYQLNLFPKQLNELKELFDDNMW